MLSTTPRGERNFKDKATTACDPRPTNELEQNKQTARRLVFWSTSTLSDTYVMLPDGENIQFKCQFVVSSEILWSLLNNNEQVLHSIELIKYQGKIVILLHLRRYYALIDSY